MSSGNPELRECPFCKEQIKSEAIKCKYCHSRIAPQRPSHGGTCPFCKEEIKVDAIKCKHCGSMVGGPGEPGCDGCTQGSLGKDVLSALGAGLPVLSSTGPTVAERGNCSPCYRVRGPLGGFIRGVQLCCSQVWIPWLGYTTVCYFAPCDPGPDPVVIA